MTGITLLGRLTSDPEKRGQKVAVARLACNQKENETVFINVKSLKEDLSSFMLKYLKKGDEIFVIGTLQDDSFVNSKTGELLNKNVLYAKAERIDFIPSSKKPQEYNSTQESKEAQTNSDDCPF